MTAVDQTDWGTAQFADFFPELGTQDKTASLPDADTIDPATLATKTRERDGRTVRFWPAGVGVKGMNVIRPDLSPDERADMLLQEQSAYECGGPAEVPIVG